MKFSTGEVSKLFQISKDTLRYYDKIGILKPEINNTNKYRYYNISHLEKLGMILANKYLGIPLAEIKTTMASENLLEYMNLIEKQEDMINNKIKELENLKVEIKEGKKVINEVMNFKNECNFDKIKIQKESFTLYALNIKDILDLAINTEDLNKIQDELIECIEAEGKNHFLYKWQIINNKEIVEDEEVLFIRVSKLNINIVKKYLRMFNFKEEIIRVDKNMIRAYFFGDYKEIKKYIIELNKYFSCNKDNLAYVSYDFSLPKKDNNNKYYVNINLLIDK